MTTSSTSIDQILQAKVPGTYFTDEDKWQIAQAIIDSVKLGTGVILRTVDKADGYPRGEKVSYRRADPTEVRFKA